MTQRDNGTYKCPICEEPMKTFVKTKRIGTACPHILRWREFSCKCKFSGSIRLHHFDKAIKKKDKSNDAA